MGDRANIRIAQSRPEEGSVYLYAHWGGSHYAHALQAALSRGRDVWGDEAYLARVILEQLIAKDLGGTKGYGITTELTDNEHPVLVVDCITETVTREPDLRRGFDVRCESASLSFADFVALGNPARWASGRVK